MEYQDLVTDFIKRTQHNLSLVRGHATANKEAYEVTQLINSMLGLLVLPQQICFGKIPQLTMNELRELGWPEPALKGEYGELSDLRELLNHLRNSITHFNMMFTETGGVLDGVAIWNHKGGKRENPKNWQVTLGLDELMTVTNRLIDLILELNNE